MTHHNLKSHPEPFDAVFNGTKKHEVRVFDRDYQVGDTFTLCRWDPVTQAPTGEIFHGVITHVTPKGSWGLPAEIGVFSLAPRPPSPEELEAALLAVKFPNGPEDKVISKHDFTWDQLKEFAQRKDWPLASKLAACCIELGLVCEEAVERAVFWRLMAAKAESAGLNKN